MQDEPRENEGSVEKRPRATAPAPSVLSTLAARTRATGPISLREEDSAVVGARPIDPRSDERDSTPTGRGAYQLQGEIARGGMGVILRAHDTDLGRDVAMKVLSKRLADRDDVIQRFVEEAQIGGQLQHPGIVPVYELGLMADERPYFTMKLVKGETLAALLVDRGDAGGKAVGRKRLLDVFLSVCHTIAYAHSRGVIHRDLKPANVMVGKFGEVQVVDWGLAKVLGRGGVEDERRARDAREELTVLETVRSPGSSGTGTGSDSMVGSVLGTPSYMPPEQASGLVDRLDERSDVFALGAILCEILTGHPPYPGEASVALSLASIGDLDDAQARLAACDAPEALVKLTRQCLVPAQTARPRNAGVVAEAVEAHLASVEERARAAAVEAAEARVHAEEERKARKLGLALAATIVALIAVGGGGLAWRERTRRVEIERIERGLGDVATQVAALQASEQFEDAVRVARTARVLVDGRPDGDFLRERADDLVLDAEGAATRAEAERAHAAEVLARERAEAERNEAFLATLEELRIRTEIGSTSILDGSIEDAFGAAFREWGVDPAGDPEDVMQALRASPIADRLAPALDDWASLRRRRYGGRSFEAETLNAIAADLDPDELRNQLREALMDEDEQFLLEVARDLPDDELDTITANLLGNGLQDLGEGRAAVRILERAVGLHQGDLRLRISAGAAVGGLGGLRLRALRHLAAAASLRPDLTDIARIEASAALKVRRYPDAVRAAERAIRLAPDKGAGWYFLASALSELGRFEEAVVAFDRSIAIGGELSEPEARALNWHARVRTGRMTVDEMYASMGDQLDAASPLAELGMEIFLGIDSNLSREALEAIDAEMTQRVWSSNIVAYPIIHAEALTRLGRGDEALEALDRSRVAHEDPPYVVERFDEYLARARALASLGRMDEARAVFGTIDSAMEEIIREEPEAWEQATVTRLLESVRRRLQR